MARLIPRLTIPGRVANFLIPADIKLQAISAFLDIVKDLDSTYFDAFIDNDVSLWRDLVCKLPHLRDNILNGADNYAIWIRAADQSMILGWVLEARPDIAEVVDTPNGRLWFHRQWAEIIKELGV